MRNLFIFLGVTVLLLAAGYVLTRAPNEQSSGDGMQTTNTYDKTAKIYQTKWNINEIFPNLPKPVINGNVHTYSNISLDSDSFSTISRVDVIKDKGKITSITIDGLKLTGEITNEGQLNVAGLEKSAPIFKLLLSDAEKISIQNGVLEVLTKDLGGLAFHYDLIAQKQSDGIRLQGTIESKQKNLKFVSSLDGLIQTQDKWQLSTAFEQAALETKVARISRGNGQISIRRLNMNAPTEISGKFALGGMSLHDFPWENVNGKIRGTLQDPIVDLFAYALGEENIKAEMTIDTTGNDLTIGGDLHTRHMDDLNRYIKRHNGSLVGDLSGFNANRDSANIVFDFGVEGIQSALRDRIVYRAQKPFTGKGHIFLKKDN